MTPGTPDAEDRIGAYKIVQRIGEGGMGVVHLALDRRGRAVAIKVLRSSVSTEPDARERLGREVETLSRIQHPRVASVMDADVMGARPYIVTRFVPGPSLDEVVTRSGPLDPNALVRVARGLADAVQAIHEKGVIHRDIKPGNVLLEEGEPVLIDFGIAHLEDDVRVTQAGLVMGTPGYLSPELVEGGAITDATDWWAWAATIVFAASGRPPFGRGPMRGVLSRVRAGDVDVRGIDPLLVPLLQAALSPEPLERPSATQVVHALERYAAGKSARVAQPARGVWDRPGMHPQSTPPGGNPGMSTPPGGNPGPSTPPGGNPAHVIGRPGGGPPPGVSAPGRAGATPSGGVPNLAPKAGQAAAGARAAGAEPRDPGPRLAEEPSGPEGITPIHRSAPAGPVTPASGVPALLGGTPPSGMPIQGPPTGQAGQPSSSGQLQPDARAAAGAAAGAAAARAAAGAVAGIQGGQGSVGPGSGRTQSANPSANYDGPISAFEREGDPRIGRPMRTNTLTVLAILLLATAAAAPGVAAVLAITWAMAARSVDRIITSLVMRRYAYGRRPGDKAWATSMAPVNIAAGIGTALVGMVLPAIVAAAGLFSTAILMSGGGDEPHKFGRVSGLVVGALLGILMAWWGPGGPAFRRGSRSIVRALVPEGPTETVVAALCLGGAGLMVLMVIVQQNPLAMTFLPEAASRWLLK